MVNWSQFDLEQLARNRKEAAPVAPTKLRTTKREAQSKYGAKPEIVDGHRFASKAEANAYRALRQAEEFGKISDLELQPRFKMPCGVTYVADFRYREGDKVHVVDVKGVKTPVFKLKLKLMRYFMPDVTVELWK